MLNDRFASESTPPEGFRAGSTPLISVVIPTFGRPDLLLRAFASARAQTFAAIEIIVVLDGPDSEARAALDRIDEPRLRIVALPQHVGRGPATNAGVQAARGDWIAFLDDDDEWLPGKLRLQWQTAKASRWRYPIVSCRLIARAEAGDRVWPRRDPDPGEPLGDYVLVQHGLRGGEGMLLPSTLLVRRELAVNTPWRAVPRFVDLDWLLRVAEVAGVGVEFVSHREPLVIWHMGNSRRRISNGRDWRSALEVGRAHADVLTPRARAAFILTQVSMAASLERDWNVFPLLIREAIECGRPRPVDVIAHTLIWTVGYGSRIRIGSRFDRWKEKLTQIFQPKDRRRVADATLVAPWKER